MHNNLTIKEASSKLNVSEATIRNWIKADLLVKNNDSTIDEAQINKLSKDIESGKVARLTKRRNRTNSGEKFIVSNYLDSKSATNFISRIIKQISDSKLTLSDDYIKVILGEYFEKLLVTTDAEYNSATLRQLLADFYNDIDDLELKKETLKKITSFDLPIDIAGDFLGLLYMSLLSTSTRSKKGTYYTPEYVVKQMIKQLKDEMVTFRAKKFLDPCCGTGNFLIALLDNDDIDLKNIYGTDIDKISIQLCRMNVFIKRPMVDYSLLRDNFQSSDSLRAISKQVDVVIGNPPWGAELKDEGTLNLIYETYSRSIDSYDLFLEQSIKSLKPNGYSFLVVPESLMNVKLHAITRKYLEASCHLSLIDFWGNIFDHVQSNAISMLLNKEKDSDFIKETEVNYKNQSSFILKSRKLDNACWSLNIPDSYYDLLEKIKKIDGFTLKDNASFALGIVTGNNTKYVLSSPCLNSSPLLKGSDLNPFYFNVPKYHLVFDSSSFQQVADKKYYYCKEKLLYKFISNKLVFAYDNNQTLSLNSANIVIPNVTDYPIKYICAILNSNVANFYWRFRFSSIKVLRSQIEDIPIPKATEKEKKEIISLVDEALNQREKFTKMNELNILIYKLYHLSSDDISAIESALKQ